MLDIGTKNDKRSKGKPLLSFENHEDARTAAFSAAFSLTTPLGIKAGYNKIIVEYYKVSVSLSFRNIQNIHMKILLYNVHFIINHVIIYTH